MSKDNKMKEAMQNSLLRENILIVITLLIEEFHRLHILWLKCHLSFVNTKTFIYFKCKFLKKMHYEIYYLFSIFCKYLRRSVTSIIIHFTHSACALRNYELKRGFQINYLHNMNALCYYSMWFKYLFALWLIFKT